MAFVATLSVAAAPEALRSVAQVRALERPASGRTFEAVLRGVVTYRYGRENGSFIIQDPTGGIFVEAGDLVPRKTPVDWRTPEGEIGYGDFVEVRGEVALGSFAPNVSARSVQLLGKGEIPAAQQVTLSELRSAKWDSCLVEIVAKVRYAERSERDNVEKVAMDLQTPDGRFSAFLTDSTGAEPAALIDAEVRLRGVNFFYFNRKMQPLQPILQMINMDGVEIIEPGAREKFEVPRVSLAGFFGFRREGVLTERVRVEGVVTHVEPGEFLCLQEFGNALTVTTRQRLDFAPGDLVEASGYPGLADSFARLEDAVIRKISRPGLPEPIALTRKIWENRTSEHGLGVSMLDSRLVSVSGKLLGFDELGGQMIVQLGNDAIPVDITSGFDGLLRIAPGSTVEVRGICKVGLTYGSPNYKYPAPTAIRILAQDAAAVTVLEKAPWWTPFRLWVALGIGLVVTSFALVWNLYLQRNMALKSSALVRADQERKRSEIEFAAKLGERRRLASDIHDGVEQSLAGVAYQIEALEFHQPEEEDYPSQIDRVRQSIGKLREQLKRVVWNMHSMALTDGNLPRAIENMIARTTSSSSFDIRYDTRGTAGKVGDFVANQTLFIAQELVSNAIKHGKASAVTISLDFREEDFLLTISDDGQGFDPGTAPSVGEGHFGIQSIRERVKRLGGSVSWDSSATGTTVTVELPCM